LRQANARRFEFLLRCDQYLLGLSDLGLGKSKTEWCRFPCRDLPLNDVKHFLLKLHDANGEASSLSLDQCAVKRCAHIAVNGPPHVLDVGVCHFVETVRGIQAKPSFPSNLDLLHERDLEVDGRTGTFEAWAYCSRDLGIGLQKDCGVDPFGVRSRSRAAGNCEHRRVLVGMF